MAAMAADGATAAATEEDVNQSEVSAEKLAEVERKMALIQKDLQETIGEKRMKDLLLQRDISIYWGTATTGKPHIGYFVPTMKLADFLSAGCEVTVLFADLHAYLDNLKSSWELLEYRVKYYQEMITQLLKRVGVPLDKLRFVRGSTFQLEKDYTLDMYKLSTVCTEHDVKKAGAEVVKQVQSPLLSGLLYPGLQALDEEYLKVDAQFGGVDQRKIFVFAETCLPRLGYKKRIHLMNPMVPGLGKPQAKGQKAKMSSSDPNSKIDLLDAANVVKSKIKKAWAVPGEVEGNGLLAFCKYVLFRFLNIEGKDMHVPRKERDGGDVSYASYAELEAAYADGSLYPGDLKAGVTLALNEMLEPIREHFRSEAMQDLISKAYPANSDADTRQNAKGKKKKNKKNKKNAGGGGGGGGGGVDPNLPPFCRVDLKVGRIVKVWEPENSDKLFCELIDLGEEEPRQIVSGLRHYMKAEDLKDRLVVVVANLKAAKLAGHPSHGMVLCAKAGDTVEFVEPPASAKPGDTLRVGSLPVPTPDQKPIKIYSGSKKEKWDPWSRVIGDLQTNDDCVATYKGEPLLCGSGDDAKPCTVKSVTGAPLS